MGLPSPEILFADNRFIVLNKPAGVPVHPGPRGGPSVEDWFPQLSKRRDGPWLAHRLDADTAGCLVIALRKAALVEAQAAFAAGRVRKTYWAVVRGEPKAGAGVIDAPLAKHSDASGWRMVGDAAGQAAMTEWHVRGRAGGTSWLELHPRTGRTHQVRVHCAMLGCPVLGDPVYGDGTGSLHLLARAIEMPAPLAIQATAPVPLHMGMALGLCASRVLAGDLHPKGK